MIIGVDPGISGAIAMYHNGEVLNVYDMPTFEIKGKNRIDLQSFREILSTWAGPGDSAIIEEVHSMPKQGVASTFSFGRAFGQAEAMLAAFEIPYIYVTPQKWKAALRLTSDKDSSRLRASELLPGASSRWPLKKHHGRAEAALLAYYKERFVR